MCLTSNAALVDNASKSRSKDHVLNYRMWCWCAEFLSACLSPRENRALITTLLQKIPRGGGYVFSPVLDTRTIANSSGVPGSNRKRAEHLWLNNRVSTGFFWCRHHRCPSDVNQYRHWRE